MSMFNRNYDFENRLIGYDIQFSEMCKLNNIDKADHYRRNAFLQDSGDAQSPEKAVTSNLRRSEAQNQNFEDERTLKIIGSKCTFHQICAPKKQTGSILKTNKIVKQKEKSGIFSERNCAEQCNTVRNVARKTTPSVFSVSGNPNCSENFDYCGNLTQTSSLIDRLHLLTDFQMNEVDGIHKTRGECTNLKESMSENSFIRVVVRPKISKDVCKPKEKSQDITNKHSVCGDSKAVCETTKFVNCTERILTDHVNKPTDVELNRLFRQPVINENKKHTVFSEKSIQNSFRKENESIDDLYEGRNSKVKVSGESHSRKPTPLKRKTSSRKSKTNMTSYNGKSNGKVEKIGKRKETSRVVHLKNLKSVAPRRDSFAIKRKPRISKGKSTTSKGNSKNKEGRTGKSKRMTKFVVTKPIPPKRNISTMKRKRRKNKGKSVSSKGISKFVVLSAMPHKRNISTIKRKPRKSKAKSTASKSRKSGKSSKVVVPTNSSSFPPKTDTTMIKRKSNEMNKRMNIVGQTGKSQKVSKVAVRSFMPPKKDIKIKRKSNVTKGKNMTSKTRESKKGPKTVVLRNSSYMPSKTDTSITKIKSTETKRKCIKTKANSKNIVGQTGTSKGKSNSNNSISVPSKTATSVIKRKTIKTEKKSNSHKENSTNIVGQTEKSRGTTNSRNVRPIRTNINISTVNITNSEIKAKNIATEENAMNILGQTVKSKEMTNLEKLNPKDRSGDVTIIKRKAIGTNEKVSTAKEKARGRNKALKGKNNSKKDKTDEEKSEKKKEEFEEGQEKKRQSPSKSNLRWQEEK